MGLPTSDEAKRYYRAAKQRFEDSEHLQRAGRTTGAVYLAGYTVECLMKALILENVAAKLRQKLRLEFRGNRGHDVEWLIGLFRRHARGKIPRNISEHLVRVATWTTNLRYVTSSIRTRDADEFLKSVIAIINWADGRL